MMVCERLTISPKSGKPHTMGEKLILPHIEEVLKTLLHKPASDNNTVQRRIDEISYEIESFLCNFLQTTYFSIQLDESTLPEMHEELLFARTLTTDTKDESIFNVFKDLVLHGKSDPFIKYNISSFGWGTCH
ncbi:hypothetical protein NQ318_010875, partial [Aromia moschata]